MSLRWLEMVANLIFDVQYRKGKDPIDVNFFSRSDNNKEGDKDTKMTKMMRNMKIKMRF